MYTIAKRVKLVSIYFKNIDYPRQTAREFNERHQDNNVSHTYDRQLMKKLLENGKVQNQKDNLIRLVSLGMKLRKSQI